MRPLRTAPLGLAFLCAGLLAASCDLRPPHVVLTVRDPDGVAAGATSIAVGVSAGALGARPLEGHLFPVSVGVTVDAPGAYPIFVEARDAQGAVVARGRAQADFPASSTGTAAVDLRAACASDTECDDHLFCDGAETCDGAADAFGFCLRGEAPCSQPPYPCVTLTCVESLSDCATAVDHSLCPATALADGSLQPRYCDPGSGCVPGKACGADGDCQDASVCNGAEVCAYHHCSAGPPFSADDGDPCTLDFCVEPSGAQHPADAALDGAACTLAVEPTGIRVCREGACQASSCGDSVVDARSESCDDGDADPSDGCDACRRTAWAPSVVTGLGRSGGDPMLLPLRSVVDVAVDPSGAVYFSDFWQARIWREAGGLSSVAAGMGVDGYAGDGGPATAARFALPESLAVDGAGNLYVADTENRVVRRVDGRTGVVTTIAGGGTGTADGLPGIATAIGHLDGIDVDGAGNLYYVDRVRLLVRRVEAGSGLVFTVAGNEAATVPGDGGPARDAALDYSTGVAVASADTIYVAERCRIRRVTLAEPFDPTSGTIEPFAGRDECTIDGDRVRAVEAGLNYPKALAVDASGDLFFSDSTSNRVRRIVNRTGLIGYVAGDGTSAGLTADGVPALTASLGDVEGIAVAPDDSLLLADKTHFSVLRVRRPSASLATWTVERVAAARRDFAALGLGPATTEAVELASLAADDSAAYFVDLGRGAILRASFGDHDDPFSWRVSAVAGGGSATGELVPATSAALSVQLSCPLALSPDGKVLYLAADREYRVRRVFLDPADPRYGLIETVAGNGVDADLGDGGPALQASFGPINGLAVDAAGRVFVATKNRVRLLTPVDPALPSTWTVEAAAGTGAEGDTGDGGPAVDATFGCVEPIAVSSRYLFVGDGCNATIRAVTLGGAPSSWTVFTVAGRTQEVFSGDGGPALNAGIGYPISLAVDEANGRLYEADPWNEVVRVFDVRADDPTTWTVDSLTAYPDAVTEPTRGDGGPAQRAVTSWTYQVATTPSGELFVGARTLRRVVFPDRGDPLTWTITSVVGQVDPDGDGAIATGGLGTPKALAPADPAHFAVADGATGRVRWMDLAAGEVRTVAGYPDGFTAVRQAPQAARYARTLGDAAGVAWDPTAKAFYVSDAGRSALYRLTVTDQAKPWDWTLEIVAGGEGHVGHLDGALADARLYGPAGLAFDGGTRTLYLAETLNHDVRAIRVDAPDSPTCVTTVAGRSGRFGFMDGPAAQALFQRPTALAFDGQSGLYVADTGNHRVRRVDLGTSLVHTVLGTGAASSSGEGTPALAFPVDTPSGLAIDASGNLFVSSRDTIREVSRTATGAGDGLGAVRTIYDPDHRPPTVPEVRCLRGLTLSEDAASLFALDECQGLLLRFDRAKIAP